MINFFLLILLYCLPNLAFAQAADKALLHTLQQSQLGWLVLLVFAVAYFLVMIEEFTHLRKSKPVILAAGIIWALVAFAALGHSDPHAVEHAFKANLLEYCELFLFLLAAMTYINVMEDRQIFATLRAKLVQYHFSYRQVYWITGLLSFFLSALADNLTTALLMCAVVIAIGKHSARFVQLACISIVVAANAGGAFSPFGDITTLMVWQKGLLDFFTFFTLFLPAVVNYLLPALLISLALPKGYPAELEETVTLRYGAKRIIALFLVTICLAVCSHLYLHMPPVLGMMSGFALLQLFAFYMRKNHPREPLHSKNENYDTAVPFDILRPIAQAEWDTLLFFYGVMLCVGGIATFGYLNNLSDYLYLDLGQQLPPGLQALPANVILGILSAVVDNIPVMYAVLTMQPAMPEGQWLLITLTTGTGGSLLAIGSAAGVALLGQSKGHYTFFGHLRWSWAILLGYFASITLLIYLHPALFTA